MGALARDTLLGRAARSCECSPAKCRLQLAARGRQAFVERVRGRAARSVVVAIEARFAARRGLAEIARVVDVAAGREAARIARSAGRAFAGLDGPALAVTTGAPFTSDCAAAGRGDREEEDAERVPGPSRVAHGPLAQSVPASTGTTSHHILPSAFGPPMQS